jgi:nitroreductase
MSLQRITKNFFLVLIGGLLLLSLNCVSYAGNENNSDLEKKINEIINYGALAPSTHNFQMWKVKIVSDDEIIVMLDRGHSLPQVDPTNRESMISLGAFIENMVEAAPSYDLEAEVHLLTGDPFADEIASIVFKPGIPAPDFKDITPDIKNRHTIRRPYLKKELLMDNLKSIKTISADLTYFPLISSEGQYLKEIIIKAMQQQVANDQKQIEFAGVTRFSKKEALAKKDGITPAMMGLSGIAKWFVESFYNQNAVLSKSFREQTVATTKKQAENCAGFVVISSPGNSVESLINVGRLLERFLIKATGLKIAVQPMSAPLEENPWQAEISQKLGLKQKAHMLLRVGYVKNYDKPVSLRREVWIEPAKNIK